MFSSNHIIRLLVWNREAFPKRSFTNYAMFRRARDPGDNSMVVGRPPTPPLSEPKTPFTLSRAPTVPPPKMPSTKSRSSSSKSPTTKNMGAISKSKTSGKNNASILSFFKKSEDDEDRRGLFVGGTSSTIEYQGPVEEMNLNGADTDVGPTKFNEDVGSIKRRKLSTEDMKSGRTDDISSSISRVAVSARKAGPFLDDSDSENEEVSGGSTHPAEHSGQTIVEGEARVQPGVNTSEPENNAQLAGGAGCQLRNLRSLPVALLKEETSVTDLDGFKGFEDMDDFDEDLFEEGDEFLERRYMEEQARLEAAEFEERAQSSTNDYNGQQDGVGGDTSTPCPICGLNLFGISEEDAGVHVNNCLDGKPTPLPKKKISDVSPTPTGRQSPVSVSQYRQVVRAPKPGQSSPFTLGEPSISGGSAFNKLMSGHAEDAAWAEAAASEHASRGKPAYQRTCPFYKILPGLDICVDAFRYGAVAGCKAYFLSHFHSDHYVGLTSSWCHGPIYCSKVTANLVKQQLRVDPRYVVPLEFEATTDVPGTKGVKVSMISANHCPGSSLFLFEKIVGKKPNGEPRLQRILHCGDFRACKMHVEHPLLMPNVQDRVSGKLKEQKIDVCYLDTTYLNPKYAFPSQKAVIQACADMCVCLSKDTPDETDGWETMKRQRAGEGMTKFVQREPKIKSEPAEESANGDDLQLEKNPHTNQQILSTINEKNGRGRLLVVVGTYSIGKERICVGIAKALNSKIYAPPSKQRIVAALEDPELDALMTTDPRVAQVHMTPLFEIRAETLDDYLRDFFPHFTRAVGFRPSGWNYRPPQTRFLESPAVATVLHGDNWRSTYGMRDLVPQRGSSRRAACFGVPYSEHSSFRELTMFCCSLRIEKIIPTVNIGSAKSRERMKAWCERWAAERRKNGLFEGWE